MGAILTNGTHPHSSAFYRILSKSYENGGARNLVMTLGANDVNKVMKL